MILSNTNIKRIVLLFSIFHFLFSAQLHAQTTTGIDPNNLSAVRIDELSDAQVMSIVKQGEASGLTIEQAQAMAAKRGLPTSEVQKLKDRVTKIQSGGSDSRGANGSAADERVKKLVEKTMEFEALTSEVQDIGGVAKGMTNTIYGQEYFRNGDIKIFDKSTDAKAPANYIIGIGDEFGVSVFGYSFYNEVLKVDSKGAINPSQIGPIFVKGLTYEKVKSLIKSKLANYFDLTNNKVEITLLYSRSITVNIVGEVIKPGSFKIPAINTAFNALIIAGGPNNNGSLRKIQIRRQGKTVKVLDIYEFLNNPNSKQDFYLEDNDYIVVPNVSKVVTIEGEINKTNSFELIEKENLSNLIYYAGGLKSTGNNKRIQIKRIDLNEIVLIDVNLDSLNKLNKDFEIKNGDKIIIRSTINLITNYIRVKGAVRYPGDYNLTLNDRVFDLIKKSGGFLKETNIENAYLIRNNPNQIKQYLKVDLKSIIENVNSTSNFKLESEDELYVYSSKDFVENFQYQVFGSVKNANKYQYVPGLTLGEAIRMAGGLRIDAENLRIEVSRLNFFNEGYVDGAELKSVVERIQLSDSKMNLNDEQANIKINPFDIIFVRAVPNFNIQETILLNGEIKYPGVYSILNKNERISDVVKRAGGLNAFAFPDGATLYREKLDGGFIVLNLKSAMSSYDSRYNYTLKPGDVLNIPTVSDYVGIRGSSIEYLTLIDKSQINAPFKKGARAKYYINNYGNGFSKNSLRRKTYVIQQNLKINRTKNLLLFKIYPKVGKGSTIYVVDKPVKTKIDNTNKKDFDWNRFIESTIVKLTGLATLAIIFRQL
jgi:protein involved in polysaccharide export with SLBB domain